MPTYPYRCLNCGKRFEIFMTFSEYDNSNVHCTHCESDQVQRLIGRIRIVRSEDSRMEAIADPGNLAGLEDDPQALGRMMRQMSNEMGEDMGPEFDEVIDRLFVLTTQTAHWFRERGFEPTALADLPMEKQALYNYRRNSKVCIKNLR